MKQLAIDNNGPLTLQQYAAQQSAAAKRGEWLCNEISDFTDDDLELVWDIVLELVMCKGLGEAIEAVEGAARVIRKQHPDEQTREKASVVEDALSKLSEEVGSSFGVR